MRNQLIRSPTKTKSLGPSAISLGPSAISLSNATMAASIIASLPMTSSSIVRDREGHLHAPLHWWFPQFLFRSSIVFAIHVPLGLLTKFGHQILGFSAPRVSKADIMCAPRSVR